MTEWQKLMREAVDKMLATEPYAKAISKEHTKGTPERVVKAFEEYFSGCAQNPETILQDALFDAPPNAQMIHVKDIFFTSLCAHHLVGIIGSVQFSYIPDKKIVGLSKVPRMVDALARRPQVQENMTAQIADAFWNAVRPLGCGVLIRAYHMCMVSRGAKASSAYTTTTELRGSFVGQSVRDEFLREASIEAKVWL